MELNYELIEYVRNFLPNSAFFDDLLPRYDEIIENIGEFLKNKCEFFYMLFDEDTEELIDYLDGNGFEIIWPDTITKYIRHVNCILIKPQYPSLYSDTFIVTCSSDGWIDTTTFEPIEPTEGVHIEGKPILNIIFHEMLVKIKFPNKKPIKIVRETVRPPP